MINLDNVLTIERADDRTIVNMIEGMREVLATEPGDVIKPYQVSGHAPLIYGSMPLCVSDRHPAKASDTLYARNVASWVGQPHLKRGR